MLPGTQEAQMMINTFSGLKSPASALVQNTHGLCLGIVMQHCRIPNPPLPISPYPLPGYNTHNFCSSLMQLTFGVLNQIQLPLHPSTLADHNSQPSLSPPFPS